MYLRPNVHHPKMHQSILLHIALVLPEPLFYLHLQLPLLSSTKGEFTAKNAFSMFFACFLETAAKMVFSTKSKSVLCNFPG